MLMREWKLAKRLPLGRALFSASLRWFVPYTGSLGAQVLEISPGHCRVRLKERWRIRNHLRSVHAIALANLCEMTSGMALVCGVPDDQRAILVEFKIQYFKKARGVLMAESDFAMPTFGPAQDFRVTVKVFNSAREHVCSAEALWKISPAK